MTHSTTTLPRPRAEDPDGGTLLTLIVALLAPLFIEATGGDIALARAAALDTIAAYRAQNHASLIIVGRIIAFGLTALGSLSLSMADELTIAMILRLRSNANALNRSAERCERMLNDSRPAAPAPAAARAPQPGPGFDEAEVCAAVAEAQQRAAEAARPRPQAPPAPPDRIPVQAAPPPPDPTPVQVPKVEPAKQGPYPGIWAAAMARVAAEELAAVARLPPLQRKEATARAAILSSTANQLLTGAPAPRPKPGDLAAMMQPNKR
jgi:hypothetical protein